MLFSQNYPPIPSYSITDGVVGPVTLLDYGFFSRIKTDSEKRIRPKGAWLERLNGTPFFAQDVTRIDAPVEWVFPNGNVHASSVCAQVSLGRGSEDLGNWTQLNEELLNNKLLAKIKGGSFRPLNSLVEYRQTAELFNESAKRLYALTRSAVRTDPDAFRPVTGRRGGRYSRPTSVGAAIADARLAYVYGVKPLVSDLSDAVGALTKRASPRGFYDTVRARVADAGYTEYSFDYTQSGWPCGHTINVDWEHISRASCLFEARHQELQDAFGALGLTNIATPLWEATRLSFVVDWFINVGQCLDNLDASTYYGNSLVVVTNESRYRRRCVVNGVLGTYEDNWHARLSPRALSGVPDLHFVRKSSPEHIANGLALLINLRGNILRRFTT